VHALPSVDPPQGLFHGRRQASCWLELSEVGVRLTRADGGTAAATALAVRHDGERTIVLGFGAIAAVRAAAVSRLLGQACRLLEPWAGEGRIELRSLRPPVRRELLAWAEGSGEAAVVAASHRTIVLGLRARAVRRGDLSPNRHRMVQLAARDGAWCVWCSRPLDYRSPEATVDHVRCRSDGGGDSLDNLVLACAPCNHRRSNRSAALWLEACVDSGAAVDEAAVVAAIRRARLGERPARRAA
jgi:5-methylcytosine-specific restriction endonuclease McrA